MRHAPSNLKKSQLAVRSENRRNHAPPGDPHLPARPIKKRTMSETVTDQGANGGGAAEPKKPKTVKCVVWDLDHTVWDGILLEDERVELRPGIAGILAELDARGILQSVASRNDHDRAMARLEALGIADYFLYPHVNWNAKGENVAAIAQKLNIGLDTFLFIDDQPFEREEVAFACPAVRTLDAADLADLLDRPELNPEFITEDSRNRRAVRR